MKPSLTCPACGYITLPGPDYGSYDGCEVCQWEDDPMQLIDPFSTSGPQIVSLAVYQERFIPKSPITQFSKDPAWRAVKECRIDRSEIEAETAKLDLRNSIIPYWKK
jgi:hypothetical protein